MTRSNNNCRTAMVAPKAGDSIREAHCYKYDNNGNIVYAGTLRVKPDLVAQPDTVQRTREEKFRWDEENHLTALSQDGYVSHYWYDADGERVIKEHGSNMAVFVNSRQDGCVTQTGRYSVYPNPYYSYGDDGRYTKHIYIGSERVLSQVGGVYGEPRILDVAGHDVRIKVDYPQIRASQDSVMESAYTHFDLPYNGTDHDNFGRYKFDLPGYWNESLQSPRDSEEDGDEGTPARTQEYLYYYHTDHLGSSTLVTDGNGQLVQQIEFLPYGEVYLERQSGDYATPYKFNGKELDEETGLYYYGARYMNPRLSIWYGCDPLQEKYPSISTYTYTLCNPIKHIDPNGKFTLENIEPNYSYAVLAVFQSGCESIVFKNGSALSRSVKAARNVGIPMLFVNDINDFSSAMSKLNDMRVQVDAISFTSHGTASMFWIGSDIVSFETNISPLRKYLTGKTILINACNAARNVESKPGELFVQLLSEDLSATIFANPDEVVAGYDYGFLPIQTERNIYTPTNTFLRFENGSESKTIKNLILNRFWGAKWDDNDKETNEN